MTAKLSFFLIHVPGHIVNDCVFLMNILFKCITLWLQMLFEVDLNLSEVPYQHMLEQMQYFPNTLQCVLNN